MTLADKPKYWQVAAAIISPVLLLCFAVAIVAVAFLAPILCLVIPHRIDVKVFERMFT